MLTSPLTKTMTRKSQTCLKMAVMKKSRVNQMTRKKKSHLSLTMKSQRTAMTNLTYPTRRNQLNPMEKTQMSPTCLKMTGL